MLHLLTNFIITRVYFYTKKYCPPSSQAKNPSLHCGVRLKNSELTFARQNQLAHAHCTYCNRYALTVKIVRVFLSATRFVCQILFRQTICPKNDYTSQTLLETIFRLPFRNRPLASSPINV